MTYLKTGFITIRPTGIVVSHMNALIYRVDAKAHLPTFKSRNGEAVWTDLVSLKPNEMMEGLYKLINNIYAPTSEPFEVNLTY